VEGGDNNMSVGFRVREEGGDFSLSCFIFIFPSSDGSEIHNNFGVCLYSSIHDK